MARVLGRFGGLFVCALWAVSAAPSVARAQKAPDPGRDLELIESTERSEDPLGLDESTGTELEQAAARLRKPDVRTPLPSPYLGEGMSSIAGVREQSHPLHVKLEQGLAFVRAEPSFVSSAKHTAELAYRLPLPDGAVVTRVRVCALQTCREASLDGDDGAAGGLALRAEPITDARGRALSIRTVLAAGSTLSLLVAYVAEAPVRGGRARFVVSPRGYDPNLAPTELHFEAPTMVEPQPAATLSIDPWSALELSARLPARPLAQRVASVCGLARCTREFEALPIRAPDPRPTWLLLDASPSMEGPARNRVGVVLGALLSVLAESTPMRAYAFAARAQALGRFGADEAPLSMLAEAPLLELDAATQISAALRLARDELARERPRIVVLSDGLFDPTVREREALRSARKLGAELWLLDVGAGQPQLAGEFTQIVRAAAAADDAGSGEQLAALEDALRVLGQRRGARGLYPGEQRVRETRADTRYPLRAGAPWLAHWLARDRPPGVWTAGDLGALGSRSIAAVPFVSLATASVVEATGMPKESVLSMLRTQLVPQARACLRSDRKGRGDYAVELTFHALFAQREVFDARVEGAITRELRGCLEALLPKLRVPAFSGAIRVHYPVHTEREAQAPVIELAPDLREQLDRAFRGSSALP